MCDQKPIASETAVERLKLNVAAFVSASNQLALIDLADPLAERACVNAAAAGWVFIGTLGVNNGEPAVHIEPGHKEVMAAAGLEFAGMLGPKLQAAQLEDAASRPERDGVTWRSRYGF